MTVKHLAKVAVIAGLAVFAASPSRACGSFQLNVRPALADTYSTYPAPSVRIPAPLPLTPMVPSVPSAPSPK